MQPLYYKPSGSHPISELPPWNYTQIGMTTFEDKPCPHTGSSFLGCIGSFHGEVEKWNDDPPKWSKRLSNHIFTIWTSAKKPSQKVWTISKTIQGFPSWESSIQLAFDLKGEDRELMSQWATSKGKTHDLDTVFSNESERYIREKQRERERDHDRIENRVGEMDAVACSDDLPSRESGLSRKKKHLSTRFCDPNYIQLPNLEKGPCWGKVTSNDASHHHVLKLRPVPLWTLLVVRRTRGRPKEGNTKGDMADLVGNRRIERFEARPGIIRTWWL